MMMMNRNKAINEAMELFADKHHYILFRLADGEIPVEERVMAAGKSLAAEVERLKLGCHPKCPGCGTRPNNENNKAVLWCDECVCAWKDEIKRLNKELEFQK